MCLIFPGLIHGMHEGELKHNGPFKASHHMVSVSSVPPSFPYIRFGSRTDETPFPSNFR